MDEAEFDQPALTTDTMDDEDSWMEVLVQEGDDDATLTQDFEAAAMEVVQSDDWQLHSPLTQKPVAD